MLNIDRELGVARNLGNITFKGIEYDIIKTTEYPTGEHIFELLNLQTGETEPMKFKKQKYSDALDALYYGVSVTNSDT